MTPREIRPHEVLVNDRVRWEYEGTHVEGRAMDPGSVGYVFIEYVGRVGCSGATVIFLDRPLPPIPTDAVIARKHSGSLAKFRGEQWRWVETGERVAAGYPVTRENFDVFVPEQVTQ